MGSPSHAAAEYLFRKMRLTLRTLLAWMDGVLPPAAAEELAGKVEASPAAQVLADRIRGLVDGAERPPAPAGPDLASEVNAVAEYLDNALDPDALADFERECLASDVRLAEVAACHRLLAETKALTRQAVPRLEKPPAPTATPRPSDRLPWDASSVASRPRAAETPATPWASWLLAVAATLLLVVLAGLFGWSVVRDRARRAVPPPVNVVVAPGGTDAGQPVQPRRPDGPPEDNPVALASRPAPPPASRDQAPDVAATPPVARPAEPLEPGTTMAPPPAPPPEPGKPDRAATVGQPLAIEVTVPFGGALAIGAPRPRPPAGAGAPPAGPPMAAPDDTPPAPAPPTEDPPGADSRVKVVAGPPLLHLDLAANADDLSGWLAAPSGRAVSLPARVVAAGFAGASSSAAALSAGGGAGGTVVAFDGLELTLRPGSHVTLARGDAAAPLHVGVLFGAIAIAGQGSVLVEAGDVAGIATLGPGGPLGVELQLVLPPGADPATSPATRIANLVTATAPVAWRQTARDGGPPDPPLAGLPVEGALPPRSRVEWTDRDPAAVAVDMAGSIPPWVTGGWPADRLDRAVAAELSARLLPDAPAAAPLEMLAQSPREEVRVAAAATLATLGDYRPLARLLCAEEPPDALREGRWQELEAATVPLSLARGPNAAAALGDSLAAEGPPGRGEDLLRLARGFGDEELAAGADAWLVVALDDPRLVIRRYAIKNLHEITGVDRADRLRYRADRNAGLRKDGVSWWRSRQERGLVSRQPGADPPRP